MAGRCTERSRIDVRSSVKMLADPAPAHDHAAKASLFEVPYIDSRITGCSQACFRA